MKKVSERWTILIIMIIIEFSFVFLCAADVLPITDSADEASPDVKRGTRWSETTVDEF